MRLRGLKNHFAYRITENGKVWLPKRKFKSADEARSLGFSPRYYHYYRCEICSSIHIAEKNKTNVH